MTDEQGKWRRLKAAAVAALAEYDAMRDQMFLRAKMDDLRAALLAMAPPVPTPATVWDIDPKKHFARVGGKVEATVTEQADGTWVMETDGRTWPTFRSAEVARKAFDDHRLAESRLATKQTRAGTGWEWKAGPTSWDLWWDEHLLGGITRGRQDQYQIHRMVGHSISVIGTLASLDEAKANLLLELDLIDDREFRAIRAGTGVPAVDIQWAGVPGVPDSWTAKVGNTVVGTVYPSANRQWHGVGPPTGASAVWAEASATRDEAMAKVEVLIRKSLGEKAVGQ